MYNAFISFIFLFVRDPEVVHRLSIRFLQLIGISPLSLLAQRLLDVREPSLSQTLFGLVFKNPVGLAGGFDKNAEAISGLSALGFGFLELGSVTSLAQEGNPRQRIFRLAKDRAIINRMGFNNHGARAVKSRLEKSPRRVPLGVSLGKLKTVELPNAPEEYATSYEALYDYGDYFVVNVSSPNTPGLRTLQDKEALIAIVSRLNAFRDTQKVKKPLLVKIAPDLTDEAIEEVLLVCRDHALDGIIATNTTLSREGISEHQEEVGGLSGVPLRRRATEVVRFIHQKMPSLPIIGVGGIFTAEDAYEKIRAGASVIQVYTGFIYQGPWIAWQINRRLARLLKRDGFATVVDAVGVDARL
ncbi:MAG: quinone-dependent dihydroorotate dehydrogenase [Patescibacteria group bacterium]